MSSDASGNLFYHRDPEQMRALGYRVVDQLVKHLSELVDKPATRTATIEQLLAAFDEPLPENETDPFELLEKLKASVFGNVMHMDHPRFLAFVPSPSNFVGVLADCLASGHNVFAASWLEASAAAQIERTTMSWLCQACGLPESAGGVCTSGGSLASLTGLVVAREKCLRGSIESAVAYCSEQTHSSIDRALKVIGLRDEHVRRLPTDAGFRLDVDALRKQIAADRKSGLRPFALIANAGTTNTGAVDPLDDMADVAESQRLWLHADAAFAGAAVMCAAGQELLSGLRHADSITLDPHKWLFQPYGIGCLLVREQRCLEEVFATSPEYMFDLAQSDARAINYCDRGIELTRPFRALKLWMTLKVFGRRTISRAIERGIELARYAEQRIRDLPDWQVVTAAQLAVVTFRYAPSNRSPTVIDRLSPRIVRALVQDGHAMISTTRLRGATVCRLCTINPRTSEVDIRSTVEKLDELARGLPAEAP